MKYTCCFHLSVPANLRQAITQARCRKYSAPGFNAQALKQVSRCNSQIGPITNGTVGGATCGCQPLAGEARFREVLRISRMRFARRGRRNATQIQVRRNYIRSPTIPKEFDGYAVLHLSDLHVDISADAMERLTTILPEIDYDLCVLTGDYRGETFGPNAARS